MQGVPQKLGVVSWSDVNLAFLKKDSAASARLVLGPSRTLPASHSSCAYISGQYTSAEIERDKRSSYECAQCAKELFLGSQAPRFFIYSATTTAVCLLLHFWAYTKICT